MILLIGIPSEPPVAVVQQALEELGLPWLLWNQRHVHEYQLDFTLSAGEVEGVLTLGTRQVDLSDITGVYVRIMDDALLPELRDLPSSSSPRLHSRAQHEALMLWLDLTTARVANRPSANLSNGSKPWQARLIESSGLPTPPTLVTNNPCSVHEFNNTQGPLIYKSASGFRSIVRTLTEDDLPRLDRIRWCPVQFQKQVPGRDVRVHVIGDDVFATAIDSAATDYRYAGRDNLEADLSGVDLPPELAHACRKLSRDIDLPFAGIDLRLGEDGSVWCFEVNPCPGFSYYESHTGQPISRALARWLAGAD